MRIGGNDGNGDEVGGLTGGANEVLAFVGNRVPVPLEELNDDLCCQKEREDMQGIMEGGT